LTFTQSTVDAQLNRTTNIARGGAKVELHYQGTHVHHGFTKSDWHKTTEAQTSPPGQKSATLPSAHCITPNTIKAMS
jgi:hypothetical protein